MKRRRRSWTERAVNSARERLAVLPSIASFLAEERQNEQRASLTGFSPPQLGTRHPPPSSYRVRLPHPVRLLAVVRSSSTHADRHTRPRVHVLPRLDQSARRPAPHARRLCSGPSSGRSGRHARQLYEHERERERGRVWGGGEGPSAFLVGGRAENTGWRD